MNVNGSAQLYAPRAIRLMFPLVSACYPTILPQAYGNVWGKVDGMLVPFARRRIFCTVSAYYAEELERNDTLEDV